MHEVCCIHPKANTRPKLTTSSFLYILSSCILHPEMPYYNSRNTPDVLAKIGKEAFDIIDDHMFKQNVNKQNVSQIHKFDVPIVDAYPYVVLQQLYGAPVAPTMTEKVINCDKAAKMFGGTSFVGNYKRKPARKGFFF
ncbi:hypothetical protein L1987_72210 [Smallanthus sonchifolius]|uniref:Uncharacterized protein n=1 Tax=Smallanthus sonchifolius TaxID=185202 RepID=A0ACB9AU03_9ASTR|nr:hypothetical protein L1987_72210 [Smallanthus sonchifolius]